MHPKWSKTLVQDWHTFPSKKKETQLVQMVLFVVYGHLKQVLLPKKVKFGQRRHWERVVADEQGRQRFRLLKK